MPALLTEAIRSFAPRERYRLLDWNREFAQTHEGRPYDHDAYPHIGAPGGPCDAFDDSRVKDIWLQWGSRLGKTVFGNSCLIKTAAENPSPMMFASATEKLAKEVVGRIYGMLERCKLLKHRLKPEKLRARWLIDLKSCKIWVGWARSVSTLADKAVRVGHANEIDKWEHVSTATEADPLKLFDDRFKEFPSHKKIKESTPQIKGKSRVERGRLLSTNCQYFVPCPHCGHYQTLRMGKDGIKGGLQWEKNEVGKSERELSRRTAHYVCESCEQKILDHHRPRMMRRGVWCPEGCTVDSEAAKAIVDLIGARDGDGAQGGYRWRGWRHAEWIIGEPVRDGPDAGYQLSSIYALSLGWGDIAAEFVDCKKSQQDLRNFVNQWLAETWEIIAHKQTWEELGTRLIHGPERFVVPEWASLITIGVDAQEDGNRMPWKVVSWGPERKHAVIAYGEAFSFEDLERDLLQRTYHYADGKGSLRSSFMLIDSGNRPLGYYEFCIAMARKQYAVLPCKGSSKALEADYKIATLGKDTSMPGMKLVHVDTIRTQAWMEHVLHTLNPPSDAGCGVIHAGSLAEHQDFLEQVLNDAAVLDLDASNNSRERWERIDENVPNDYRDTWRYAYVAMLIATRGRPINVRGFVPDRPPAEEPTRFKDFRIRRR